jgi:hypothetical protein
MRGIAAIVISRHARPKRDLRYPFVGEARTLANILPYLEKNLCNVAN